MNPWLLAEGFSDRLEIEVDWVEGCKPGPKTIEGLRRIAVEYGPPGRPVEITLDDEIPRAVWDGSRDQGDQREQRIVEKYADLSDAPYDPEFRSGRLYVLFVPASRYGLNGYSTGWFVTRGDSRVLVDGIVVFRAPHARYAKLWLSLDKMERMTLIHEFDFTAPSPSGTLSFDVAPYLTDDQKNNGVDVGFKVSAQNEDHPAAGYTDLLCPLPAPPAPVTTTPPTFTG